VYTPKAYPGFESLSLRFTRRSPKGVGGCQTENETPAEARHLRPFGRRSHFGEGGGLWRLNQGKFANPMAPTEEPAPENARFFYVYILLCNDGDLYTGCTHNLKERINRHRKGWVPITKERLPVHLLWSGAFPDRERAFAFERYFKSGSGRAFLRKRLI
jgi:putative endonuclease